VASTFRGVVDRSVMLDMRVLSLATQARCSWVSYKSLIIFVGCFTRIPCRFVECTCSFFAVARQTRCHFLLVIWYQLLLSVCE
jgi:hypothetical protein